MRDQWDRFKRWWCGQGVFDVYLREHTRRSEEVLERHRALAEHAAEVERARARAALRDGFAKAALTGLLANPSHDMLSPEEWASDAYNIANAMMKARERVAE